MDLVKIVGEMIDLREELKESARDMERKARKIDRTIDELMENLKHYGLIETRNTSSKKTLQPGT